MKSKNNKYNYGVENEYKKTDSILGYSDNTYNEFKHIIRKKNNSKDGGNCSETKYMGR